MMVKMGEPDAFTPLMKVSSSSLSSRKRRRKSTYHSDVDDSPSKRSVASQSTDLGSDEPFLTPMSLSSVNGGPTLYVNAKTFDNLSFITKGEPKPASNYSLATPPKHDNYTKNGTSQANHTEDFVKSSPEKHPEPAPLKKTLAGSMSYVEDDAFLFQLVIDDKGKAALSNKTLSTSNSIDERLAELPSEMTRPSMLLHSSTAIGIETWKNTSKDDAHAELSKRKLSEPVKPMLPSYATLLSGSETDPLPEKLIVPQTPQSSGITYSETPIFMQTESSANGDLAFNLTPQFNAMMYLMMNINSPQQKKGHSLQQSFLNPQLDLNHYSRLSGGLAHAIDTRELLGAQETSPKSLSPEEVDARAALRKAFGKGR